jgi:osmotically-inducible protein OsmY
MNGPRTVSSGSGHGEPPQYLVQRLRRAIAEDPRTAEMGVQVRVRGEAVFLSGEVASLERCHQLATVVHEVAPELTVHNDVHVVAASEPVGREELS